MIKQNLLLLFFICALSNNVLAMESEREKEIKFALSENRVQLASAEQLRKNLVSSGYYVFLCWEHPAFFEVGSGKPAGTLAKYLGGKNLTLGQLYDTVSIYIDHYTQDKYEEVELQHRGMGFDVMGIPKPVIFKCIFLNNAGAYEQIMELHALMNRSAKHAIKVNDRKICSAKL